VDIDARWPSPEAVVGHEAIRKLVASAGDSDSPFGDEYPLDDPEIEPRLPPLIYDADSSQHSALIDVLAGKNLAIHGPPRTGKSQTITNIIGAALAAGKSVLFVAEKNGREEILACAQAGITVTLPKPMTSGAKAEGRLSDATAAPSRRNPAYERIRLAAASALIRWPLGRRQCGEYRWLVRSLLVAY
jgi:hypothetical protein